MDANGHSLREEPLGAGQGRDGRQKRGERKDIPQEEKVGQRAKQKHWFYGGRKNRGWRRRKKKYTNIAGVY